MSADLIPFPSNRRCNLIDGIVAGVLCRTAVNGERHIQHSLKVQATVMRRKGIAEDRVAVEQRRLEAVIRERIWNEVFRPREIR